MSDSRKDRKDVKGKFGKDKGSHVAKGWKKGSQRQGFDEFDDDKFDWTEFRKKV
jgi:hypothetical protein